MTDQLFDWINANEVQPPCDPTSIFVDTSISEDVMILFSDGSSVVGYAVYVLGKFARWNFDAEERPVTHWAYIH